MSKRIGMLLLAVLLLIPGQGSYAQDNSAQKQKILADFAQAVTQLNGVQFGQIKPETAVADGPKTLASIQQYETDPLFVGSKELTDLYYDEFQVLFDLGLADETIQIAIIQQPGQGASRSKDQHAADEQQLTDAQTYLLKAIDRASVLSSQQTLTLLPQVYIELGVSYSDAKVYLVLDHHGDFTDPAARQAEQNFDFLSQEALGKAAIAAKAANLVDLEVTAYYNQARALFDLATTDVASFQEDAHGLSAGQWYAQAIATANAALALRPSSGVLLSALGSDLDFYTLRIELGLLNHKQGDSRVPDDAINLDTLLVEQIQVENRLLQLPETTSDPQNLGFTLWSRGIASIRLALRTNNVAMARSSVADLTTAIPAMQQLAASESYYGDYPLIAQTLLGRALVFIGERPDLALNALQAADTTARQFDTSQLTQSIYTDWDQGLKQQNALLEAEALSQLGRYDEAIAGFKAVLAATKPSTDLIAGHSARGLSPELVYSDALAGLAQAYQKAGLYDQALDPLQQRRTYFEGRLQTLQAQSSPDPALLNATQYGVTDTIIQLSIPLLVVGRSEEALTGLQHALDIAPALNDPTLIVDTQLRISDIYLQLNLKKDALDGYSKAADVANKGNLPQQRGRALLGLGSIQSDGGLLSDAQTSLTQAVQSAQIANDTETQIRALLALGDLTLKGPKPNPTAAGKSYSQALALATRAQDTRLSLDPLLALADLQAKNGDRLSASVTYYRALAGALAIDSRETIATVLGRIGGLEAAVPGRAPLALQAYSDAINQIEQTQRGFQSSSLKTAFDASYAGIYGDYLTLLFQQKQYEQAFNIAERARARAFLDQLAIGPVNLKAGASADLLNQETVLRQQIDAAQTVLINAQNDPSTDPHTVATLTTDLQNIEDAYSKVFTRMQAESPVLASLTGVQTASLAQIQATLDSSTTLLEFYTTDQQSFAFIVTAHSFMAVPLAVTQSQLAEAVTRFRADEKQADGLADLATSLIKPILSQLQTKHLLIVPHNVLNYLPFAALPLDNGTLLGDQFAIRYVPSATSLVYLPALPAQPGNLLAFGNPAAAGQRPLPYAEAEVKGVSQIAGGDVFIGADATKTLFLQRASGAGVVYVAAHGTLNSIDPLFSGLELAPSNGQSGRLEANELYSLDLTQHTSLVVLSACDTAVGSLSAGDEFTGINRAFLYAGAPAVIATLWSIDDKATSLLMEDFFKARATGLSNSEALQSAQQALRSYKDDLGQTPYVQPYFWAAFILTGRD